MHQKASNVSFCFKIFLGYPLQNIFSYFSSQSTPMRDVWVRYLCGISKVPFEKSIQNVLPIHWKIIFTLNYHDCYGEIVPLQPLMPLHIFFSDWDEWGSCKEVLWQKHPHGQCVPTTHEPRHDVPFWCWHRGLWIYGLCCYSASHSIIR